MKRKNANNIIIPNDPPAGPPLLVDILLLVVAPPLSTIAGLYFLYQRFKAEATRRQLNDYRHYAAIIGDRSSISIRELATRLNKAPDEVAEGLQDMIDRGFIDARAYVDRNGMVLHLQGDFVETEFAAPKENLLSKQKAATPEPARAETAPVKETEASRPERKPAPQRRTGTEDEDFEEKLREIRALNEDIQNERVSAYIDRIGALTASIFRVVREKPERTEEVRKFMNYYLPTTLKLLKSYSLMEKQSYQGENIQASRKKIENVLETLVHGFEQQQDKLFKSEALDVETDISVLQTMLASDGLTSRGGGLHL